MIEIGENTIKSNTITTHENNISWKIIACVTSTFYFHVVTER